MKNPLHRELLVQAASVCACTHFRKSSRAVTQFFDLTLEPVGLRSTQLILLIEIEVSDDPTVPWLARKLVMDRSSVSRALDRLERRNLVERTENGHQRSHGYALTEEGRQTLVRAFPLWKRAQLQMVDSLGKKRWQRIVEDLTRTVQVAREIG